MRRFFRSVLTVVRETVWIGVAVACLFGGYKGFQYLRDNRTIVEVAPVERPVTLVETMELVEFDAPLPIRTQGFIQPNRVVQLSSPSGGRIAWLHPSIIELGLFEKGEVLVQFDATGCSAIHLISDAMVPYSVSSAARSDAVMSRNGIPGVATESDVVINLCPSCRSGTRTNVLSPSMWMGCAD